MYLVFAIYEITRILTTKKPDYPKIWKKEATMGWGFSVWRMIFANCLAGWAVGCGGAVWGGVVGVCGWGGVVRVGV